MYGNVGFSVRICNFAQEIIIIIITNYYEKVHLHVSRRLPGYVIHQLR